MKLSDAVLRLMNLLPDGTEMLAAIAPFGFVTNAGTGEEVCVATREHLRAFYDAEVALAPAGPPRGCLAMGAGGAISCIGATIEVGGRACVLSSIPWRPVEFQHHGPPRAGMVETGDDDETSLWVAAGELFEC